MMLLDACLDFVCCRSQELCCAPVKTQILRGRTGPDARAQAVASAVVLCGVRKCAALHVAVGAQRLPMDVQFAGVGCVLHVKHAGFLALQVTVHSHIQYTLRWGAAPSHCSPACMHDRAGAHRGGGLGVGWGGHLDSCLERPCHARAAPCRRFAYSPDRATTAGGGGERQWGCVD